MNEIEIMINGMIHVALAVVMFIHIDKKCYPKTRAKVFFLIPLWSLFLGFYYIRSYLDGRHLGSYWREFEIFETVTNLLFLVFFCYKNQNLRKDEKIRRHA